MFKMWFLLFLIEKMKLISLEILKIKTWCKKLKIINFLIPISFWLNLGDKQLDGYQKKKYVCKLLFIFLLGNDIDFGHMEAVNLLSSNKYSEKQIVSIFQTSFFEIFFRLCRTTLKMYI